LGIVHYTNNSISNYYGEGFHNDTFTMDIPYIMYHAKTASTMGITLKAYGTKKVLPTNLSGFTTEYYDLVETSSLNIVGKVFNDLKLAIIEDDEIINVLSLKSNRSHTLPNANWNTIDATASEISASNFLLGPSATETKYLAITYLFKTDNDYDPSTDLGFSTPIHCGYINKFYPETKAKNIQFNFSPAGLLLFKQQSEISTGDVKGYNASDLHILSQLVTIGEEPDPTQWKEFNYTSDLTGFGTWGATTIPRYALTDSNYFFNKNLSYNYVWYDYMDSCCCNQYND